jgi:hypothetical protein
MQSDLKQKKRIMIKTKKDSPRLLSVMGKGPHYVSNK